MTVGKSRVELVSLAKAALQEQPGCSTAEVSTIEAIETPSPDGPNWAVGNVFHGNAYIGDIKRGVIAVNYQLGRRFHLVTED
jgi:hypothetical protein